MVAGANVRRFTLDEVSRMLAAGILDEDDRLELLDGLLITMSPINPPHANAVTILSGILWRGLPHGYQVRTQDPVRLSERSAPQPDIAVVRGVTFGQRHPEPGDVALLIEVSDASLDHDLAVKLPLYARAGIPETWIVDLVNLQVLIFRAPFAGRYSEEHRYVPGDTVALLAFPELRIAVAAIVDGGGVRPPDSAG